MQSYLRDTTLAFYSGLVVDLGLAHSATTGWSEAVRDGVAPVVSPDLCELD